MRKIGWLSNVKVSLVSAQREEFYCPTFWNSCAPCWCTRAPIKVGSMQKLPTLHHPGNGTVNYFSDVNMVQPNWNYVQLKVRENNTLNYHYEWGHDCNATDFKKWILYLSCISCQLTQQGFLPGNATNFWKLLVITMPVSSTVDITNARTAVTKLANIILALFKNVIVWNRSHSIDADQNPGRYIHTFLLVPKSDYS